mmetsp:Transcript_1875/g.2638  ORF Transcript_1875/g.2638 Transcript_1875/m.2638 type:complete len:203 (+) Transcript_1875:63-671(+)
MVDPNTVADLDGVPCTRHILKTGRRAKECEDCAFSEWEPGDVKYILEEWEVGVGDLARVHLCPTCAIKRGLPPDFFHKNVNDMRECPNVVPVKQSESDVESDDERKCKKCNVTSTSQYPAGASQIRGLLEVTCSSGDLMILFAKCWIDSTSDAASRNIDASSCTAGIGINHELEQSIETTAGSKRKFGLDSCESPQSKRPAI